jgi:hypothetical protein
VPQHYNPVVRTFNRLRAGLVSSLGVDRRHIRPDMPLELLLPVEERREVWRHLRQAGLDAPWLELSPRDQALTTVVAVKTVVSLAVAFQAWWLLLGLPCAAYPLLLLAYDATRSRAVHFPLGLTTVGELTLALTSFREHAGSGYRPTRNEIAFKVRLIVAESLGLTLDAVQEDSTFEELGAC